MDKYTVDLDQVLNDFEYSELTDQQSKNASEKPQSSATFQPPPVTKHSINNVFHSLNEYLNSEISSKNDRVAIGEEHLGYDHQNLGKNDNNLVNNLKEPTGKVIEASNDVKTELDVTKNNLESLNNTLKHSGQNERLLKLKNVPQIEDSLEKVEDTFDQTSENVKDSVSQLHQLQEVTENLNLLIQDTKNLNLLIQDTQKIQPNLLEFVDDTLTSINNEKDIQIESDPPKESNDYLNKTDKKNISLLDMENVESELIPELNCTESYLKGEFKNVNNDKKCDKNVDNKADNNLNNEQIDIGNGVSFLDVNECEVGKIEGDIVNILENKKDGRILIEDTENIEEKTSDEINISENVENFVIEPSESPYAFGQDSSKTEKYSEHNEVTETSVVGEGKDRSEKDVKLENSKELLESDNEVQVNTSCINEDSNNEITPQISENVKPLRVEMSKDNDIILMETTIFAEEKNYEAITIPSVGNNSESTTISAVENNTETSKDKSENEEQKIIVGFSTDLDIDENELNKMLEELEIEEDSALDENLPGEAHSTKTENRGLEHEEGKIEDTNMGVDSLVPAESESGYDIGQNSNERNEPQFLNTEAKHDLHKEILLERSKDEENLKKSKENIDTRPIECLEIEKPSKSKKKHTEKPETIKKEHTETAETLQEQPSTTKEDTKLATESQQPGDLQVNKDKKPVTQLQEQQSQDSLTRPQDLPLNNDLKEDKGTRKIDLIGSPGSTPYNNVYINKSIEPKTTQDTDSDYTSSASPTFSDCSTESTSTASTASVEDFPKNIDSAANICSETSGQKNKHSGKMSKNRGQGVQEKGDSGANEGKSNVHKKSKAKSKRTEDAEGAVGHSNENVSNTEQNASDISKPAGGDSQESSQPTETFLDKSWLGKEAPLWIPDSDAAACLHCDMKFTVLKRRHHCRACGLVLCSKCCNLKFRLEYLDTEARVCTKCFNILNKDSNNPSESGHNTSDSGDSPAFRPNPNNPLEYCSTVSPLQQMGAAGAPPPSVMVPVGVLKRKGSNKKANKSVMFCDGIAPGSDLTHLDQDFNYHPETKSQKSPQKIPEEIKKKEEPPSVVPMVKTSRNQPKVDQDTDCFIPKNETSLPPTVCVNKTDILYSDCSNSPSVVEMLKNETLTFAINQNLFVQVKVINMSCCINKQAWCFSTDGLINVGSDEIVYLIEYIDEESFVPKDVFFHINNVYLDAVKGTSIKEQGLSLHNTSNFLDSKNHAGFVYIRPTFQCLENVLKPKEPYLIGILIHRWETPWAKLFPLRLILRLGAEYRYYPSPLISTRHRESVFVEIGHTIINLLADFRNFTYTLPQIRGLIIHMEDKKTTITIPKNRYDQVMKSINNSSEHILAFAGNFSSDADSHLVCIQDTQGHENCYTTHAINIHNKPRKITGASFIVFNGSLKSSSGLTAKSNIVEDGLMIQIPSEHMDKIRENLRNMKNHTIACGCINTTSDETVNIVWGENDVDFNVGVQSSVDSSDMKGVPSIRVHNGKDYFCNNGTRLIRWTEVFILQNGEENPKNQDPVDISKVSESIAKACCTALVNYLDLLVSNSCQKIGIRATLHVENVSYSAGSNGLKLPPIYMRSLDNELIPVLHRITSNNPGDSAIVLELIFRILNA